VSPDGKFARVTRMTKPFSYIVPVSNFGSIEEVWDAAGTALAKIAERQLNLGAGAPQNPDPPDPTQAPAQAPAAGGGRGGGGAANNGKRDLMWREDGQGFNYLQLEPPPPAANTGRNGRAGGNAGGDQAQTGDQPQAPAAGAAQAPGGRGANVPQTPRKDRLMQWAPPFSDASTKLIYENPTQMSNVRFSPDGQIMFFTENNSTVAMYLTDMTTKYTISRGGGGGAGGGRAGGGGGQGGGRGGPAGDTQAGTLMSALGSVSPKSIGGGVPVMLSADGASVYLQSGGGGGGRGGGGGGGGNRW
jgi:hypothetical protein